MTKKTAEFPPDAIDQVMDGYVLAALWSTNDESTPSGGEPLDKNYGWLDIDGETLAWMRNDCKRFMEENTSAIRRFMWETEKTEHEYDYIGHDFWLTRNGHGVGLWDRNAGAVSESLTKVCHKFGGVDLYVGDDGKICA